jgi:hypothetical protein
MRVSGETFAALFIFTFSGSTRVGLNQNFGACGVSGTL